MSYPTLPYINDLDNNIKSKVRLFADDTIIYRNIRQDVDQKILQEDLNTLEAWETKWQMEFNVSKCHVLCVTDKRNRREPLYTLHEQKLQEVKSAKYLGVEIASNLSWGAHVASITAKANRASGFVYRNLKGTPKVVQTHCYKALVRPVLEYASPV